MAAIDSNGILHTRSGKKLPPLSRSHALFLDRSVAVYGPSGAGKTVFVKNVMQILEEHIEQVIIVAPTEPTNRSYENFVDPQLIHYRLYLPDPNNPKKDDGTRGAMRFLQAVWYRQEMMAAVYKRANRPEILSQLFSRLPAEVRQAGLAPIRDVNAKRGAVIAQLKKQYANDPGRCSEKLKDVDEKFLKMLVLLYKKFITPHYETLWGSPNLSEDEEYSLCYINFNPRLLLIFDDCAAQLKPLFTKDIIRLLFYQGRHSFITILFCAQDDTDLPTNLRKNAFISMFAEPIVCLSNFERPSNKFPKPVKQFIAENLEDIYQGFRKLAYIREDPTGQHFYYLEWPNPRPFHFGSAALQELCVGVGTSEAPMDRENPYYERFRIQPA
jgi:hypothetical protein